MSWLVLTAGWRVLAARLCCALACGMWLLGCHGVGRALVDQRLVQDPGKELCDGPVPVCVDPPLPAAASGVPSDAEPVDLQVCAATATCPAVIDGLTGGGAAAAVGCDTTLSTDGMLLGDDALGQRYCATLNISDDADTATASLLELDGVHLQSVNVTIASKRPLTLSLGAASLSHVWFELRGPITLRVDSSRELGDVRVSTPDPALGQAKLVFDNSTVDRLAVGTQAVAFGGQIEMRRSSIQHGLLQATAIELESVALRDVRIVAGRLQASDATLQRVALSSERALFAGCNVSALRVLDCGDFTAIQGAFVDSRIEDCATPVRLLGTDFNEGVLDGPIVLDDASLSHVRLGLREPVAIEAWDSHIDHVRFCSPKQSISFGGVSSVACSRCDGTATSPPRVVDACIVGDGMYDQLGGPEACAGLVDPPPCTEPEPMRMRPPH